MTQTITSGLLPVNGVDIYYESRGEGGVPLVVVHGGFGVASMFGDQLDRLAAGRRVVAIELQGHGHTADVDRPFGWEGFGDDVAGVVTALGLERADLLGYSMGGCACLRAAIQHPDRVRRLVVVAAPCRREAYFPEVRAALDGLVDAYDQMRASPLYESYAAVAPDPAGFATLVAKSAALERLPFDWSEEVRALPMPVLLVCGDADIFPPAHAAEFFALLGGGLRDAGWDGAALTRHRLAILPATTHYALASDPRLGDAVVPFLE